MKVFTVCPIQSQIKAFKCTDLEIDENIPVTLTLHEVEEEPTLLVPLHVYSAVSCFVTLWIVIV